MKIENNTQNLKKEITEQVKIIYDLIGEMQPKSKEEFINLALPNLHIKVFELINLALSAQKEEIKEKIQAKKIKVKYGTLELEQQYWDRGFNSALDDIIITINGIVS